MKRRQVCLVASVLATWGCGGQEERDEVSLLLPPQALDDHIVYVDDASDRALLLDVGAAKPVSEVEAHPIAPRAILVQRRNGHNELLLMSWGNAVGDGVLQVLGPSGVDREYAVGSRFDRVQQSSDGRFAFLSFSGDADDSESILFNPNEVAIIDLQEKGDAAVFSRSLDAQGSSPTTALFSPAMDVNGEERRFLVVLFDSHAAILDLNYLADERPAYTVELSEGSIGLSTVRFSPQDNKIYLLGARSNDIYVISLLPAGGNRANDFEPSLNQLGASSRPSDMRVFGSGSGTRLLAVSGSTALVIEAGSNRVTSVPLSQSVSSIMLYEGTAPFDDQIEERAVLYAPGSTTLTFVDLDQIEERTTRNLEDVRVGGPVSGLLDLGDNLVLVTRGGGLSMLDLNSRRAAELDAPTDLSGALPSLDMNRLWVAPKNRSALAYLDFSEDKSTPGQVALNMPISNLMLFTGARHPRVAAIHQQVGGAITILDAVNPGDADEAVMLRGFFYSGLLDD